MITVIRDVTSFCSTTAPLDRNDRIDRCEDRGGLDSLTVYIINGYSIYIYIYVFFPGES